PNASCSPPGTDKPPGAGSPRRPLAASRSATLARGVRRVPSATSGSLARPSRTRSQTMSATEQEKAAKAREAALQGALTQIEREFGKGTVMRMGDEGAQVRVDAIPTGALSLDLALGIGGAPRGRIVEVFGPESSGKTTLVYHVLAE